MKTDRTEDDMLYVDNLSIEACIAGSPATKLVSGVSFHVPKNQVTAIVGESGSGKTLTALAIMGLLPEGELRMSGGSRILFCGQDLLRASAGERNELRGKQMAMVFQDPGSSLNPVISIGNQIEQPLRRHHGMSRSQARARSLELLDEVGIPSPHIKARAFPHELSGGQQQRVMIAMAIACGPKLIIADEPTSALDTTVQRQILDLFARLQREHELTMLFITHDLGIVGEIADHVVVFHHGSVKEQGEKTKVIFSPTDPYTRTLIASRQRLTDAKYGRQYYPCQAGQVDPKASMIGKPHGETHLLEIRGLIKQYTIRNHFWQKSTITAVNNVSFSLDKGQTLGIVGESGSGKSTVAMSITRLIQPNGGEIRLDGKEVLALPMRDFRTLRRRIQMVFQNPYASLNPRRTIRRTLLGPMELHGLGSDAIDREHRAVRLLEKVGLQRGALDKLPHQFSGGERQRIAIARALSVEPDILICDEAVSALDVTVQLQVLDLLRDLQRELGIAYVFISHDLTSIRYMADRLLVMRSGETVEEGVAASILDTPNHPYTAQLLAAEPRFDIRL